MAGNLWGEFKFCLIVEKFVRWITILSHTAENFVRWITILYHSGEKFVRCITIFRKLYCVKVFGRKMRKFGNARFRLFYTEN